MNPIGPREFMAFRRERMDAEELERLEAEEIVRQIQSDSLGGTSTFGYRRTGGGAYGSNAPEHWLKVNKFKYDDTHVSWGGRAKIERTFPASPHEGMVYWVIAKFAHCLLYETSKVGLYDEAKIAIWAGLLVDKWLAEGAQEVKQGWAAQPIVMRNVELDGLALFAIIGT